MSQSRLASMMLLGMLLAVPLLVVVPPLLLPVSFHFWVQALSACVVLVALPAALAFPLMYAPAAWWRTHLGRALMMMAVGVGWIIITAALRVLRNWPDVADTYTGDPVNVDLVRLAGYIWVMTAVWYMVGALWAVSRRGRDLHSDDAEVRREHDRVHPPT